MQRVWELKISISSFGPIVLQSSTLFVQERPIKPFTTRAFYEQQRWSQRRMKGDWQWNCRHWTPSSHWREFHFVAQVLAKTLISASWRQWNDSAITGHI